MKPCRILCLLLLTITLLSSGATAGAQEGLLSRLFKGEKQASHEKSKKANHSLFGGPKRVEITLTEQQLRAYEGNRLVMQTRISSGKNRGTPTGNFTAGPYKAENHYSSLYDNAHMPWSVQVFGNIFVHGFAEVPDYPASRGCIRVPVTGNNLAKRFYNWVETGTPIRVAY
jgi:lipoprotein-anchoring transpeptidase ErfK/SrfK